jgi:menaquinol-cytochrome c reductase iron-sulfur subunit
VEPHSGDDKAHLPPPTLWPVGVALGIVCILVGLVVSWPAVAVGGGIVLVFGFLWARDVMARSHPELRTTPAVEPEHRAPVTAALPAPPEPEPEPSGRFARSRFLEGATLGIGGLIGGAVTVPAVGFMAAPAFVRQGHKPLDLGPLTDFPEQQWMIATFLLKPSEGEVTRRTTYIRNNGLFQSKPSFTIVSNRCAHLGCPVQPGGLIQDNQAKTEHTAGGEEVRLIPVLGLSGFTCPCHGGSYDDEGNRIAGPPVRALDRYAFSVVNGHLVLNNAYSVDYVRGTGASARIKKYTLTDPGEHVAGPEGWLYPLQPPH